MKQISMMIKPASSACNLRCRYCFYEDVSTQRAVHTNKVMDQETMDSLIAGIAKALNDEGQANIGFQGGEPTLAGLAWFRRFTEKMAEHRNIRVTYAIQTNGTLINEEWADFLAENHFLTGVSLDGFQTNMDRFRFDADKKSVYFRILNSIDLLKKRGADVNILTVVTRQLAKSPKALFQFFKSHHYDYVQLIPCLPELGTEQNEMSLTPDMYEKFFTEFFDCWLKDYESGGFMSVGLFENLACMLEGMPPYQCGMLGRCSMQYVIESNGDVYPCDFYCLDEYLLGNIKTSSFKEMAETENAAAFLNTSRCTKKPCGNCPYIRICNGGCRRQNVCYLNDETCGYKNALDRILPELRRLMHANARRQSL